MITMLVKKAKEHLTVRVPSVVKRLIAIETAAQQSQLGVEFSAADFIEMAVYRAAASPESRALLLAEIQQNAGVSAMLGALGVKMPIEQTCVLHDSPSSNLVVSASSPEALAIVDAASGKLSLLKPAPLHPTRPPKPISYRDKRSKKPVE